MASELVLHTYFVFLNMHRILVDSGCAVFAQVLSPNRERKLLCRILDFRSLMVSPHFFLVGIAKLESFFFQVTASSTAALFDSL